MPLGLDTGLPLPVDAGMAELGLGLVIRFGSRARGTNRPSSDLDLAVERTDGARLTFAELGALALTLAERFGLDVDVVDLRAADTLLRREVITDGQVLHADARERCVALVARTLIDLDDLGPMLDACVRGVLRAARSGG